VQLRLEFTTDSPWRALHERFSGIRLDLPVTLCDHDDVEGPRLLLHRPATADDEVGFYMESDHSGLVEIAPAPGASRALIAAAWRLATTAGLSAIRLAPGEASLVRRTRERLDAGLEDPELSAHLAVLAGSVLENGTTGSRELDLILRHVRSRSPHPFEILNALPRAERDRVLDSARASAGLEHLPWPLRRDLSAGTKLAERRVELRFAGPSSHIRLIRPQSLNALDPEMLDELSTAWHEAEARVDVEKVILEAEGPAFMAGIDLARILAWMESDRLDRIEDFVRAAHRFLAQVDASPLHTIAYVDGLAVGAGAEFCCAFDRVYGTNQARLGFPELSLGIYPAMGGTQRLPRRVGVHRARALVLEGRPVSASRAVRDGLVNAIVTDQADLERYLPAPARARAATLPLADEGSGVESPDPQRWKNRAPVALALVEELIDSSRRVPLTEGLTREIAGLSRVFSTEAALHGIRRAVGRARRSRTL
jgi:enoyl-CoA hydratase/3-hydroxyacyl-CoA dehydrogenase